jgi:hypothetical protein
MGKKSGILLKKKSFNISEDLDKRLCDYMKQTNEKNATTIIITALKDFLRSKGYYL